MTIEGQPIGLALLRSFHQDCYAEVDVFVAQVRVAGSVAHPDVQIVDLVHDVLDAVVVGLEWVVRVHFPVEFQIGRAP